MKKVVWPSKKQTINYSLIVVALSLGMAIFFGVLDYAFNIGLEKIIRREPTTINQTNDGTVLPNFDVNSVNVNGNGSVDAQPVSTYPTKPAK